MNLRFKKVNVCGISYRVLYFNDIKAVDVNGKENLFGQAVHENREIRLCIGDRSPQDIFETFVHEIVHCIEANLDIRALRRERVVVPLSMALADTFVRNGIVKL